jgi:hypothetical protein
MNKGRVMCQGPASSVPAYFADNGHPIPAHYNPADWIMVRIYVFFGKYILQNILSQVAHVFPLL